MFVKVYTLIFCPEAKNLTPPNKVNWPKKAKKGPKTGNGHISSTVGTTKSYNPSKCRE